MFIARSSDVAFPDSLADSVAAVTSARATTARRKSSADGPSSLTNAVTSHDDIRIRAPPILTVVIDLPREGGVAISCSQTCSMQFSKSSTTTASASSAAGVRGRSVAFLLAVEAVDSAAGSFAAGRGFPVSIAVGCGELSPDFTSAFSIACSTSVRSPSSFSKAWLTDRSV